MTPAQFEQWLELIISEFNRMFEEMKNDRPLLAQGFFDKARAYENALFEFKKVKFR